MSDIIKPQPKLAEELPANAPYREALETFYPMITPLAEDINEPINQFMQKVGHLSDKKAAVLAVQYSLAVVASNFVKYVADAASKTESERRQMTKAIMGKQMALVQSMLDEKVVLVDNSKH